MLEKRLISKLKEIEGSQPELLNMITIFELDPKKKENLSKVKNKEKRKRSVNLFLIETISNATYLRIPQNVAEPSRSPSSDGTDLKTMSYIDLIGKVNFKISSERFNSLNELFLDSFPNGNVIPITQFSAKYLQKIISITGDTPLRMLESSLTYLWWKKINQIIVNCRNQRCSNASLLSLVTDIRCFKESISDAEFAASLSSKLLKKLVCAQHQTKTIPATIQPDDPINIFIDELQTKLYFHFMTVGCLATNLLSEKPGMRGMIWGILENFLGVVRAAVGIKSLGASELVLYSLQAIQSALDVRKLLSQSYDYLKLENCLPECLTKLLSPSNHKFMIRYLRSLKKETRKIAQVKAQFWYKTIHSPDLQTKDAPAILAGWEAEKIIYATNRLLEYQENKKKEKELNMESIKDEIMHICSYGQFKSHDLKSKAKLTYQGRECSPSELVSKIGRFCIADGQEVDFDLKGMYKGETIIETCGKEWHYLIPATPFEVTALHDSIKKQIAEKEKSENILIAPPGCLMHDLSLDSMSFQSGGIDNLKKKCKKNPDLKLCAPDFFQLFSSTERKKIAVQIKKEVQVELEPYIKKIQKLKKKLKDWKELDKRLRTLEENQRRDPSLLSNQQEIECPHPALSLEQQNTGSIAKQILLKIRGANPIKLAPKKKDSRSKEITRRVE